MAKSNKEKQADFHTRQSNGGMFKPRKFYIHPDDAPAINDLVNGMRERRLKDAEEDRKEARALLINEVLD